MFREIMSMNSFPKHTVLVQEFYLMCIESLFCLRIVISLTWRKTFELTVIYFQWRLHMKMKFHSASKIWSMKYNKPKHPSTIYRTLIVTATCQDFFFLGRQCCASHLFTRGNFTKKRVTKGQNFFYSELKRF